MSRLWVPPSVSREHQASTERFSAELVEATRREVMCDYWDRELQKIDPALTLIKAHDDASVPGLRPGYWHIIREVENGPPSILPLVGDEGEYVEPTSRMLDVLRAGDLQNPRVMEDRRRHDEAKERAAVARREAEHELRVGEMMEKFDHLENVHVGMSGSWTNSVAGRRAKS